jgi:hypothetical protein
VGTTSVCISRKSDIVWDRFDKASEVDRSWGVKTIASSHSRAVPIWFCFSFYSNIPQDSYTSIHSVAYQPWTMESKQKNIDADAKKQSFLSSTTTTMNIYVDENINKNEEQQKEHQRRTLKPANLNVFTDASNNKFETQQEQQQDQRQMLKKKKNGYYHKKYKNKNKNHNGNNNNKVHIPYHRDHHHRQPSNNQGYLSYEEGVVASMQANQYYSTGFQPPSPGCIPGCQHLFHVPHPQQEHHSYVDDDNGYNCVAASHFSPHPPPCSWMDVLDNNTVVAGVVFINGGEIKIMNIPPTVGAGLVGELLVQKENHKASSHHHHDPNGNANTNAEEERPVQGNADVSGFGDQGIAPSSLLAPADYQGSPFVQRGSAPSHLSSNPHHRPNNHADYHRHYAMHAPTLNPQQPHNGCGSLLPSDVSSIQWFGI